MQEQHGKFPKRIGTREIVIALEPEMEFERIVDVLKETLVVPELEGIRGCRPCLSGLDRLVIESHILERIG